MVRLAESSNRLFGGTANYLVARQFAEVANYDEKLALMRCLFAVSAIDQSISIAEEGEITVSQNELRIDRPDLVALRVAVRATTSGHVSRLTEGGRVLLMPPHRPVGLDEGRWRPGGQPKDRQPLG